MISVRSTISVLRISAMSLLLVSSSVLAREHQEPCSFATRNYIAEAAACILIHANTRLIIVGELHGTNETPALVGEIVDSVAKQHRSVLVGLEMPKADEVVVRKFVDSNGSAHQLALLKKLDFWKFPDGRATFATLSLIESIRQLRSSGYDVGYFAMEPNYPSKADMNNRFKEDGMAESIKTAISNSKRNSLIIALMGNYHSCVGWDDSKSSVFGLSVTDMVAGYKPLVVDVLGVRETAWNCEDGVCGIHSVTNFPHIQVPSLVAMPVLVGAGHRVSVFKLWLPALTASKPIGPVYH